MAPSSSSRPLRHHQPLLLILAIFVSGLLASVPASAADGRPELGGDGLHREILRDETVLRLKELGKVRPIPFPRVLEIFSSRSAFPAEMRGDLVRLLGTCVACRIG
jgi:hypothetical protein